MERVNSFIYASLAFAAFVPAPAHAADQYYLESQPIAGQTTRFNQGVAALYNEKATTTVRVKEVGAPAGQIALEVFVLNRASHSINFGAENITISSDGGAAIEIISFDKMIAKEQGRQKRQRFWAGLAAMGRSMSAADAGTTHGSGIYSGTSNGHVGNMPYSGTTSGIYSYTTHNPAVTALAQQNAANTNAAERQALAARQAGDIASYDAILRTTTVDPGDANGGHIRFEVPKSLAKAKQPVLINMTVIINGDTHRFTGRLRKAG